MKYCKIPRYVCSVFYFNNQGSGNQLKIQVCKNNRSRGNSIKLNGISGEPKLGRGHFFDLLSMISGGCRSAEINQQPATWDKSVKHSPKVTSPRVSNYTVGSVLQYQLPSFPNLSLVAACDRLVLNIIWKPVQILRQSKTKVCTLLEGLVGSFFIFNGRHEPQHHSLPGILLTCQSWNFLLRYTSIFLYQLILSALYLAWSALKA